MARNLIRSWCLEESLGVFGAIIGDGRVIVPILEYDKIGDNGDFTKPFTYTLEYIPGGDCRGMDFVSRNLVPELVKKTVREFIRSGLEKRGNMPQSAVGIGR